MNHINIVHFLKLAGLIFILIILGMFYSRYNNYNKNIDNVKIQNTIEAQVGEATYNSISGENGPTIESETTEAVDTATSLANSIASAANAAGKKIASWFK